MRFILSIAVVFNLLLGTMNFHFGVHLCEGELKSLAFFGKAKPCEHAVSALKNESHTKESVPACHHHSSKPKKKTKGCCDDQEFELGTLDITTTVSKYKVEYPTVYQGVVSPFVELGTWVQLVPKSDPAYLNYKPPLIHRDIPVLIQSFLI